MQNPQLLALGDDGVPKCRLLDVNDLLVIPVSIARDGSSVPCEDGLGILINILVHENDLTYTCAASVGRFVHLA